MKLLSFRWLGVIVVLGGAGACTQSHREQVGRVEVEVVAKQLVPPLGDGGGVLFEKLAAEATGVRFENRIDLNQPFKRLYHSGLACGGIAVGDFDGDGRHDLFIVSGSGGRKLYRQVTDFRFEDITEASGLGAGVGWGVSAAAVDIDGDGDLDIYVCQYDSPNALYLNDGEAGFREAAQEFGLDLVDACLLPTFCDYDRDGDLDLYLLTNRYYREGGRPTEPPVVDLGGGNVEVAPDYQKFYRLRKTAAGTYGIDEAGRPDRLLRNDGGRFIDASEPAGIRGGGHGLAATWWDFDSDGWMDIYVSNDFIDPDRLYRNNRDGTFTDVIAGVVNYTPWSSMGADAGDINNDGLMDFIALDMAGTTHYKSKMSMGDMGASRAVIESIVPRQVMRNCLFINSGAGPFSEAAGLAGIASSDWSWAAKFSDFDNDGRIDLFVTNGSTRDYSNSDIPFTPVDHIGQTIWDYFEKTDPRREKNLAFRNLGDLEFEPVAEAWGLDHLGMSSAAAHADLDADGDLDLVVMNFNEPVSIYRNGSTQGERVTIALRGRGANRFATGAVVELSAGGVKQVRQQVPVSGFLASNAPELHFGLGEINVISELKIRWPDGGVQILSDLEAGNHYTITQPGGQLPEFRPPVPAPMFEIFAGLRGINHKERIYEDFVRQPLLPNKLSQLGPGIAIADVDGNGHEDFFVGCARGQSGAIFLNDGGGKFRVGGAGKPFDQDKDCEDMGILFFDADSDGDPDLYVASGSYEYDPGDPLVRDRLYLNDGSGAFARAPEGALPDVLDNSSCVCAADFDRDGDLDLFVGGRVVSGDYPRGANSRLLVNVTPAGGVARFVESSETSAPGLRETGLVTAALWSDADGDGWIDLLVAHEWGPVKFFKNRSGVLAEATAEAGLGSWRGWWNSITGGDVDNDGDIDYAVGNAGLNTKYHASADHPARIYYGDYDGSGSKSLVEAKYEEDQLFPIRGKSCSTDAMPNLGGKFKSFHQFASSTLADIYEPSKLDAATKFEVNTLASGLLINDGSGHFVFQPLPNAAQTAPVFGIDLCDIDADGKLDLYAVQNFSGPQFETPPFRGGLSLLLLGNGDGSFRPVPPSRSGMLVRSDGRGLAKMDLDRDGRADFLVGVNDGELLAFIQAARGPQMRKVRLVGEIGNPLAAGARLTLELADGGRRAVEIFQGGGYLSQSSPSLFLDPTVQAVVIRWPDGGSSRHEIGRDVAESLLSPGK